MPEAFSHAPSSAPPARLGAPIWARFGQSPDRPVDTLAAQEQQPSAPVRWTLAVSVVALVMTDRFGLAIGGFSLGLSLPLVYLLLAVLLFSGRLRIDPRSLALYCGIATVGALSYFYNANSDGGRGSSVTSLALLFALYLPLVFCVAQRPGESLAGQWRWMMRMVGNVLLVAALAGIVQFYLQFVYRPNWLFDLSVLIPEPIRASGVYNSAIPVGSLYKANGLFSREPSSFSFWMALGLLIELSLFRRVSRMLLFALALLLSYSGTGLLALAIGLLLPFRLGRYVRLGLIALLVVVFNLLVGDPLNIGYTWSRLSEFSMRGTSGYARYVAPLQMVAAEVDSAPWTALIGHGAGTILRAAWSFESHDPTWAKLLYEYGIAGFVLFLGLMVYKLHSAVAPLPVWAVLLTHWLMMGGYLLTPEPVGFLIVAVGLWPALRLSTSPTAPVTSPPTRLSRTP